MTFEIKTETTKIRNSSLDFHIRLEIAGADLIIEDLDIDVEFVKSKAKEPNKSTITIWNVSEDTFKRLFKTTAVDVYTWFGDDEPAWTFRGYVDVKNLVKMNAVAGRINSSKGFLAPTVKQDNKGQFDIPTIIELVDSKVNYKASKINKNYSSSVKTKQLMNDCIEAMGLGIGFISENLTEKTYSHYKLKGRPHIELEKVLAAVGASFYIRNSFIYITTYKDENKGTYAVVLTPENSLQPDQQSEEDLIISTQLITFLNAGDWVKLQFKEIEGVENVYEVRGKMNNYGTAGSSDIVIKFPKEKKKRKKKAKKAT